MDTPKNGAVDEPITHVEIPDSGNGAEDGGADEGGESEAGEGAESRPTLSDLADAGFSTGEIEMAKKQGRVQGESDGDKGDGGNGDAGKGGKPEDTDGSTKKDGEANGKKEEKTVDERFRILSKGKSPEQIMAEVADKGTLSPEQETVLLANLSQNGQALYWSQKKERQKRQKLETDSTAQIAAKQKEIDDLKAELAKSKVEIDPLTGEPVEIEVIDPKKKPLTVEELEKIEADKAAKEAEENAKRSERAAEIHEALEMQQVEAKARYEDFDEVMGLTADILKAANEGKLEALYPDSRKRSSVLLKARTLLNAYANADKFGEGDFNAADLTYELGKEHPGFGKPKNNAKKTGETGADGDPEKAARVITNASRRGSSATLTGGGSRRVALDELTPEQAARLPHREFRKLPKATQERLLRA